MRAVKAVVAGITVTQFERTTQRDHVPGFRWSGGANDVVATHVAQMGKRDGLRRARRDLKEYQGLRFGKVRPSTRTAFIASRS